MNQSIEMIFATIEKVCWPLTFLKISDACLLCSRDVDGEKNVKKWLFTKIFETTEPLIF